MTRRRIGGPFSPVFGASHSTIKRSHSTSCELFFGARGNCAKGPDCNRSSVDRCLNKDSINALLLSGIETGPKSIQR